MMKSLLYLLCILGTGILFAEESTQYQVGVGSAFSMKNWSERPEQFSRKDVRPPPAKLSFGLFKLHDENSLSLKASLSFLDSQSSFLYLSPTFSHQFSFVQVFGGVEGSFSSFSEDSKYDKTAFNADMVGAFIGAKINLWTIDFHATFYARKVGETEIAGNEGVKTKMAHESDRVQKYGAIWKTQKFAVEGELARFLFGETTIVSKEFYYRVEKNTLYRTGLGAGAFMGDLELWGRFYQFKTPDDELAIYYQAPSFVPDYTLSKRSVFVELIWKI
ncbi:MAG: hypothetical protein A2X86_14495 [Bdellovibrionales bacterium GWA2_49_15]|nr:MAG: hypothetical protein A2X86_14495 [Bdellovibrionales bacterium GWA2_49_15]HAZ13822.1 hypothetical protein [Bdellovibrionales bacterium]